MSAMAKAHENSLQIWNDGNIRSINQALYCQRRSIHRLPSPFPAHKFMSAMAKAHKNSLQICNDGNIRSIKDLVDEGILDVPSIYVRPVDERPCFSEICNAQQIPIIDLAGLRGDGRTLVIQEIGHACEEWGFFQVINHGVPQPVVERMWAAAQQFFAQAPEERLRFYSEDVRRAVVYATSFNPSVEAVREWKDSLVIRCFWGQYDSLQEAPEVCRGPLLAYLTELQSLAAVVYGAIFESLGLSASYLETALPALHRVATQLSYYPPCPDPSLALGLGAHSDAPCLTILKPDEQVPGLQVRKADRWVEVKPLPNSFVINVGDQIQILTNGKYKSAEHRVVTNSEKPRMSIPCFFGPRADARIAPLSKLIDGTNNPALYKETIYGDYTKNFYSKRLLSNRATLDFAKV